MTDDTGRTLAEQIAQLTKVLTKQNKTTPSSKGPGHSASAMPNQQYRGAATDQAAAQKLIQSQGRMSVATQGVTEGLKKTTQASLAAANKMGTLSQAAGSAASSLTTIARAFGAGGALMAIAKQLDETTDMYRKVNSYGQEFSGSMLQMQLAAAGAALPLDQFAEAVKNNARVLSTVGTKAFFDLNKQLRNSMTDVGQLGMTTGQLNTFMGNYMETQRLYGNVSGAMTEKSVQSMKSLAIETQKAALATGANRDELAKATQEVLRDTTLRAKMSQVGANGNDAFSQSLMKTTTYLAALPGEAGKTLSQMLAQSVGRGTALMADQTAQFAEAGMLGVTDMMDNLARKVQAGTATGADVAEFNRQFVAEGERNMESLKLQAASGNKAAEATIRMILEAKESLKKPIEDPAKQKGITNFMLNFQNLLENLSGTIRTKFFGGLEKLMQGFEGFTESPAFKAFQEKIGGMAERLGKFLSETITPERLIAFGEGLASTAEAVVKFATFILGAVETVTNAFGWLSDKIGVLGASVAVFATYMATKFVAKQAGNLLAERFTIGGRQENLTQALNRFAAGNSLRVTLGGQGAGGQGGPDLDGPDRDEHRDRERERSRNRNQDHNDPERRRTRRPEIEGPQEPRGRRIQRRLQRFGDTGQSFRQRAARVLGSAARRPGAVIRNVGSAARRAPAAIRNAGSAGVRAIRAAPGRVINSRAAGRVGGAVRNAGGAVRRVGGAVRGGAGAIARGGMNIARGIGPGALAGMAVSGALSLAPDFKGKETIQTMAEFAAMGSMLGPIGAAVGAGVGALYANWDDLSGVASSAFSAVKDYDYAGAFKKAGDMLAPIGDAAKWVGTKYVEGWKAIGGFAMDGITAIKDFDYSGALTKAGEFLAPVGEGAKWIVGKYVDSWKAVGGFAMDGLQAIADFDYAGAFNKAGELLSPLKDGASWMMDTYINTWKSIGNGLMDGVNSIANFDYAGMWSGVKDAGSSIMGTISGAFSSIGASLGGVFDWASDLLMPKDGKGVFNTLMNLNPVTAAVNTMLTPSSAVAAPTNPQQQAAPQVNTDGMTSQMAEMKAQNNRISKENSELKAQMAVLLDQISKGNASNVGGLRDLINEQKKSNGSLSTLANNTI